MWLMMLLRMRMMVQSAVVLRGRMVAHLAWGVQTRRKWPGAFANRVLLRWNRLLLLLHVISAVVQERGRETHRLLLISHMLSRSLWMRMWRRKWGRVAAMRESLVEVCHVAGAPGTR